jgi:hypothetical protein
MRAHQTFKKLQLLAARKEAQIVGSILVALSPLDPLVQPLALEKARVSRTVINTLWDALPPEHLAYQCSSIEALKMRGQQFLSDKLDTPIILHCGWDMVAFATTVRAAWETMETYYHLSTEGYNTCMYPESFNWFVIRAGKNLYPMDCGVAETPTLIQLEGAMSSR